MDENISNREWLKKYKGCRLKFYDGAIHKEWETGRKGNLFCGLSVCGDRCMYKKCPLINGGWASNDAKIRKRSGIVADPQPAVAEGAKQ